MSVMQCETVKVVRDNEQGFCVINKSDMQETDKIFQDGATASSKREAKPRKRGRTTKPE